MTIAVSLAEIVGGVLAAFIGLVAISFLAEKLRSPPKPPEKLSWESTIPVQYVDVGGVTVRYVKAGTGRNVVLLHTLRTQLDLFERVLPGLAKHFTVYALDYPGHGYSDIPKAKYDADFFVSAVEGFLNALELREVMLCGVSIGGAISLVMLGRRNPRVAEAVAINPYDYAKGGGIARSSALGRMIMVTSAIPIVGETVMRLRNFIIMKAVLRGGVANSESISPSLLKEMYEVGDRRGHYRAFISLLRNAASWEAATEVYRNIEAPVHLVWGDRDWSAPAEREHDQSLIPSAETTIVENGGHFLPLDRSRELQQLLIRFAGVLWKAERG